MALFAFNPTPKMLDMVFKAVRYVHGDMCNARPSAAPIHFPTPSFYRVIQLLGLVLFQPFLVLVNNLFHHLKRPSLISQLGKCLECVSVWLETSGL